MSKHSRLHRPNVMMIDISPEASIPDNLPRPYLYHPCGLCGRGGGTLKKVPVEIVMLPLGHGERKIRVEIPEEEGKKHLYEHTEARFCQGWHVPKRFFKMVEKVRRQAHSRAAQEFHATGRGPTQRVAFQRKSV